MAKLILWWLLSPCEGAIKNRSTWVSWPRKSSPYLDAEVHLKKTEKAFSVHLVVYPYMPDWDKDDFQCFINGRHPHRRSVPQKDRFHHIEHRFIVLCIQKSAQIIIIQIWHGENIKTWSRKGPIMHVFALRFYVCLMLQLKVHVFIDANWLMKMENFPVPWS
jgi:hypothetical protein